MYAFPPSCLPDVIELPDAGRGWEWKAPRPPASLPPVIALRDKPSTRQRTELEKQRRRDRDLAARAKAKSAPSGAAQSGVGSQLVDEGDAPSGAAPSGATRTCIAGSHLVDEGDAPSGAASSGYGDSAPTHQIGECSAFTVVAAFFATSDKK